MALSYSKALRNFFASGGSLKRALQGGVINVYSGAAPVNADAAVTGALLYTFCDYNGARGGETLATGTANYTGSMGGEITTLTVNGVSIIGTAVGNPGVTLSSLMTALSAKINSQASSPDYTASASASSVTITAVPGTAAGPNGFVVTGTITQAGKITAMAGGVAGVTAVGAHASITITGDGVGSINVDFDWGGNYLGSVATTGPATTTQMAQILVSSINFTNYFGSGSVASSSGAVVTVTAPPADGTYWNSSGASIEPTNGNSHCSSTSAVLGGGVDGITGVKSSCQIDLTGAGAGGLTSITALTVNAVSIINAAVPFNTSDTQTATDLAASINTKVSAPDYTATSSGAVVTILAALAAGAGPNGFIVKATCSPSLAIGSFVNMAGGAASAGIVFTLETRATGTMTLTGGGAGNTVDTLTVNGVDILGGVPVLYNSSLAQTASDVSAVINQSQTSPDYAASAIGAVITITASPSVGTAANGLVVTAGLTGITATFANMAGGVNSVNGVKFDYALNGVVKKGALQRWYACPAASATGGYFRLVVMNGDTGQADTTELYIRVQGTVGDMNSAADLKLLKATFGPEQSIGVADFRLTA